MGKEASLWGAALVGAAVLALSGCSAAENRDTTIIRVAFNQSESHPEYIAMTEFGKKFSEATDGKYEVQIYPNAIMGDQGAGYRAGETRRPADGYGSCFCSGGL